MFHRPSRLAADHHPPHHKGRIVIRPEREKAHRLSFRTEYQLDRVIVHVSMSDLPLSNGVWFIPDHPGTPVIPLLLCP
jgi:hypothetical protein